MKVTRTSRKITDRKGLVVLAGALTLLSYSLGTSSAWSAGEADTRVKVEPREKTDVADIDDLVNPTHQGVIYEYAVKIVCGIQKDPENTRLTRGFYATAVNIRNPHNIRVKFRKSLALTYPPGFQQPGKVIPIAIDELGPREALATDCIDIEERIFPNGLPNPYVKGFVVIESPRSLDVTAVYSSASLDGNGGVADQSSLDIEQVRERIKKPRGTQPKADLIVRNIDDPRVECPTGNGSCKTTVRFRVANIGAAPSGPCQVRVVLDPAQSVVVTIPIAGLNPGASQVYSVTSPPGGNCYDPDCTICITVDSTNIVPESNEGNNTLCQTNLG